MASYKININDGDVNALQTYLAKGGKGVSLDITQDKEKAFHLKAVTGLGRAWYVVKTYVLGFVTHNKAKQKSLLEAIAKKLGSGDYADKIDSKKFNAVFKGRKISVVSSGKGSDHVDLSRETGLSRDEMAAAKNESTTKKVQYIEDILVEKKPINFKDPNKGAEAEDIGEQTLSREEAIMRLRGETPIVDTLPKETAPRKTPLQNVEDQIASRLEASCGKVNGKILPFVIKSYKEAKGDLEITLNTRNQQLYSFMHQSYLILETKEKDMEKLEKLNQLSSKCKNKVNTKDKDFVNKMGSEDNLLDRIRLLKRHYEEFMTDHKKFHLSFSSIQVLFTGENISPSEATSRRGNVIDPEILTRAGVALEETDKKFLDLLAALEDRIMLRVTYKDEDLEPIINKADLPEELKKPVKEAMTAVFLREHGLQVLATRFKAFAEGKMGEGDQE